MESADAFVSGKLDELRKQLAQSEDSLRRLRKEARSRTTEVHEESIEDTRRSEERRKDALSIDRRRVANLREQVQLLEQIKDMLEKQRSETKSEFSAIEKRDTVSSKQSFWLTVGSSTVSLIAGWFLSLVGNPATILHLFTH